MMLKLQARGLWMAVNVGTIEYTNDRNAIDAIALKIPPKMQGAIASKATAKIAWDPLKETNIDVDQVHQTKAKTLRRKLNSLSSKMVNMLTTSACASRT
jgi:capsid portal protein